jgi:hypothetical protein
MRQHLMRQYLMWPLSNPFFDRVSNIDEAPISLNLNTMFMELMEHRELAPKTGLIEANHSPHVAVYECPAISRT